MAPLTVLAGPTGAGKTGLAVEIARAQGAEIVSADSQQVYRGFDIGTAKPTPAQLAAVPHHLISCVDPSEGFSAARFQALADQAIDDIQRRGRRVVVVGGTGLYLRVLLHGVVAAPSRDEGLRASLEAFADEAGDEALHRRLEAVDPASARRIPVADRVRSIRALEISLLTGRPASAWRADHDFAADRYPYRLYVLDPPRPQLYAAIDARARAMFEAGLLEEVRALLAMGLRAAAPMNAVGYAQALECVDGTLDVEGAIAATARATRRYAKRQWTWFRRERGAVFVAPPYDVAALSGLA